MADATVDLDVYRTVSQVIQTERELHQIRLGRNHRQEVSSVDTPQDGGLV
jgi:hypothetical protein